MFKRVPGGAKSTESSSKSSSTEGRARWAKLRSRADGGGFPNRRSYGTQVPLAAGGLIVGILSLGANEPGTFTNEHLRLAKSLAVPASVAIQNAGIHERAELYAAELELRLEELRAAQQALQRIEKPIE